MVRDQLGDCPNPRVREAMAWLPRQWFVPPGLQAEAYADHPLAIGAGQTISQPRVVAFMLSHLALRPGQRVLDLGAGSGYVTALLARLVGPDGSVVAVERHRPLVAAARPILHHLAGLHHDLATCKLLHADGSTGCPEHAPFDGIHCGCAGPTLRTDWIDQLAPDGRLIAPVGPEDGQYLELVMRQQDHHLQRCRLWPVRFVPLCPGRA